MPIMDLDSIRALTAADSGAVDRVILDRLGSDVVLINQIGHHIVHSGGKRLRPLLVLLGARACGCGDERHILMAAAIEFIHTATLLHDDVVDASELRRGSETANSLWGNEASVLVGDFLYTRAFQMMVEVGDMRVLDMMADTTNIIAEGEVMQLMNCHDPDVTEARYREVIRCKTAELFRAGAQMGALLAGRPEAERAALAEYGLRLGTAFQLVDDALDYSASAEDLGKNIGDDLAEGKPTLPLIHALRQGTPEQQAVVRQAIEEGGLEHIGAVLDAIESTQAIAYTSRSARAEADQAIAALAALPDSPFRDALHGLAEFAVSRSY